MKKLWLGVFLVLIGFELYSASAELLAIPVPEAISGSQSGRLINWVKAASNQGLKVYYYNQHYLLGRGDKTQFPSAFSLGDLDKENLYLLADRTKNTGAPRYPEATLLFDLKSCQLISSQLPEAELRKRLQAKIIPLDNAHVTLQSSNIAMPEQLRERNFINDLLTQVSSDSLISYVQHMQDFQTRYANNPNRWDIANWLKGKFQSYGYATAYLDPVPWDNDLQYNVIAQLTGTVYPESCIIVGAHYDSQSWDSNPMFVAPGADDNATGVAAILEIARIMKASNFQPRCSILFIPLAAEEIGCIGTYGFLNDALQSGLEIRLMINMDMIGNTQPYPNDSRMLLHSYDGCLEHAYYAAGLMSLYTGLTSVLAPLNEFLTDSYPFWEAGYPAISFDEYWMSPVYHSSQDTVDQLDPLYFGKLCKGVLAMTAHYSYLSAPPLGLQVADPGTGSSLLLNWSAPADPLVDHYVVRWGTEEWSYEHTAQTFGEQLTITGLTEGIPCYIAVSSADLGGLESYQSRISAIPLQLPRAPNGFCDTPVAGGINLSWEPNQELDIVAYHLYRSLSEADPGSLIASIPAPVTTFQDSGLPGLDEYYCYRLCAYDTQGNEGTLTPFLKSRPITLDRGILIIDETLNYSGANPFQPTDEMVDSFYDSLFNNLNLTAHLDLEENNENLRLADLCIYSSILWHGNDFGDYTKPSELKAVLKAYVAAGGNLMFSVCHPGPAFELSSGYPASFGEEAFINQVLGVQGTNYANSARFKYAISQMDILNNLQVDSLKTIAAFAGHIFHVEGLQPSPSADAIFCYGSDYADSTPQGQLNGCAVGVRHSYGAGQTVLLSFPLFFMRQVDAYWLLQIVFTAWFNEPVDIADQVFPSPELQMHPAFPNPFSENTTIRIDCPHKAAALKAEIYNLKGQLVWHRELVPETPNLEFSWDGRDSKGRSLSSGVYFIRVIQGDRRKVARLLLLK